MYLDLQQQSSRSKPKPKERRDRDYQFAHRIEWNRSNGQGSCGNGNERFYRKACLLDQDIALAPATEAGEAAARKEACLAGLALKGIPGHW